MKNFRLSPYSSVFYALALLAMASEAALAQTTTSAYGSQRTPPSPPQAPISLYQEPARTPLGLSLEVAAGNSIFPDLQAPVSQDGITRVDGTTTAEDSTSHQGVLLAATLSYERGHRFGLFFSHLSAARANSAVPVDAPAASYVRYSLDAGSTWSVGRGFSLLGAMDLRRTMFRNTDNGHYLDAVMLKAGLEQKLSRWTLSAFAGIAAMSRFGYMQDSSIGSSGSLANTTSGASEVGGRVSWSPVSEVELFANASQENINATVADTKSYESFGLKVDSGRSRTNEPRDVRLSTTMISVGAVRKF